MFWGDKVLRERLPSLISDYSTSRLDQGTYRLRIGHEVYVSPTGEKGDRKNKPKTSLQPEQAFTIPAGQFAFLLTEEQIVVPEDAIAFISVRATYKFRGLVNVSGFHVDPKYTGRLIFAVFNAGPGAVHLERGEECFQIWFASMEGNEDLPTKSGFQQIESKTITSLGGESLQSLAGLHTKIRRLEIEQTAIRTTAGLVLAILIGMTVFSLRSAFPFLTESLSHSQTATETTSHETSPEQAGAPVSEDAKGRQ